MTYYILTIWKNSSKINDLISRIFIVGILEIHEWMVRNSLQNSMAQLFMLVKCHILSTYWTHFISKEIRVRDSSFLRCSNLCWLKQDSRTHIIIQKIERPPHNQKDLRTEPLFAAFKSSKSKIPAKMLRYMFIF